MYDLQLFLADNIICGVPKMRISHSLLLVLLLSACEYNGGAMPIDSKNLLSGFEGPKTTSINESQLEAAKNAEKNENFRQSAQIYQQVLEKEPENASVALLLAESFRRSGEYDKAISIYDALLAKAADNIDAKEGKGLALLAKGDFEKPVDLFETVLKADAKRWKSTNGMGVLFVTRGLYPEATQYFEEALKQSPDNASILNNLALAQALVKQYDKAIGTISKALAQAGVSASQRKHIDLNLALIYASYGKLEEARKLAENYLSGALLSNNLGLYAHLARDDGMAKSYLNMALTESKTYYSKAWENLEAINSEQPQVSAKNTPDSAQNKKPEDKKNKKSGKDNKPAKQKSGGIIINQEPVAEKSEVKAVEAISEAISSPKTDAVQGKILGTVKLPVSEDPAK